jgi:hypothetical protein
MGRPRLAKSLILFFAYAKVRVTAQSQELLQPAGLVLTFK